MLRVKLVKQASTTDRRTKLLNEIFSMYQKLPLTYLETVWHQTKAMSSRQFTHKMIIDFLQNDFDSSVRESVEKNASFLCLIHSRYSICDLDDTIPAEEVQFYNDLLADVKRKERRGGRLEENELSPEKGKQGDNTTVSSVSSCDDNSLQDQLHVLRR